METPKENEQNQTPETHQVEMLQNALFGLLNQLSLELLINRYLLYPQVSSVAPRGKLAFVLKVFSSIVKAAGILFKQLLFNLGYS